jgi:prolipoprotein diacylglyceryl transferase
VWYLGPVPIRAYAVFIIIGIVVALLIGDRRWRARGGEPGVIYDVALLAVPFGLIGGRLYHVLTDWSTYFGPGGAGLMGALRIWDGGLGIWGAVALGGVGAWIACRIKGIPLPAFGDAVAPGIVLAQAIGRLGNYFNQELYGRETTVPWGMEIFYRRDPSGIVDVHSLNGVSTGQVAAVVHPTFLYELLWNLLVFVLLILIDRRFKIGHGRLFAMYVALYCVGRFGVELLRDDTATQIAGIRINSFTATFAFLGAVVYIILARKGREDPQTLRGRGHPEADESPEFARELAAVGAGTGIVAAATVADREYAESDTRYTENPFGDDYPSSVDVLEVADEDAADGFEPLDELGQPDDESGEPLDEVGEPDDESGEDAVEPLYEDAEPDYEDAERPEPVAFVTAETGEAAAPEVVGPDAFLAESGSVDWHASDADDVEPDTADESIVEAELASPGIEVETVGDAEDVLIDEDHDPIDEDELEGLSDTDVTASPTSEQGESMEAAYRYSDDGSPFESEPEVVAAVAPADEVVDSDEIEAAEAYPDDAEAEPIGEPTDESERGSRFRRVFRRRR